MNAKTYKYTSLLRDIDTSHFDDSNLFSVIYWAGRTRYEDLRRNSSSISISYNLSLISKGGENHAIIGIFTVSSGLSMGDMLPIFKQEVLKQIRGRNLKEALNDYIVSGKLIDFRGE